ncbi:MAG: hypothetical protein PHC97_04745 [Patescibacteria group bacterium]|nr:hypothetical protein [Patescibacteria group bacterium]
MSRIQELIKKFANHPLELLRQLGGYYSCPKDPDGKRLGPLVGYAGKDDDGKNWVGDVYVNFVKAEEWPRVLFYFASDLEKVINKRSLEFDTFCGMPMGGIAFAEMLALVCDQEFSFMEKKVTALATATNREESRLETIRHEIKPGQRIIIVEDVTNNFSTTGKACEVIMAQGGIPVAIVSFLNRSVSSIQQFVRGDLDIPVISLVTKAIDQYRQGDPFVEADVISGNLVRKPKAEWPRLMKAVEEALKK